MQSSFLLNENEEQSERNSQALQFMFKRQSYIYKVAATSWYGIPMIHNHPTLPRTGERPIQ